MVEAVVLWNEPNNLSHWNFEVDPGWNILADMVKQAATAVKAESPGLVRDIAPPSVPVVLSTDTWDAYDVPVAPYFVPVPGLDDLPTGGTEPIPVAQPTITSLCRL